MTTTELKIRMKEALNLVDKGEEVLVTRKGAVYKIVKVA
jgi:antitoxin (DNA-binding transcriptional repressor) of toxin-antitoxin stability system